MHLCYEYATDRSHRAADVSDTALNDTFIGMAVGIIAGRAVLVNLRAGALALPETAE